nr:MAG TPA: hypothetical protein [Caudoviricetes sp.]
MCAQRLSLTGVRAKRLGKPTVFSDCRNGRLSTGVKI